MVLFLTIIIRYFSSKSTICYDRANFKKAISRARGEYIFLCDQDDVWLPGHIRELKKGMDENPEFDVLTSGVDLLIEEGSFPEQCERLNKESEYTGLIVRTPCDKSYHNIAWPGCTYCVRRSFIEKVALFWEDDFPHDAFLYCTACVRGTLGHYDAPTLRFRRHSDNASDERITDNAARRELIGYYRRMNAALRAFCDSLSPEEQKAIQRSGAIRTVEEVDAFSAVRLAALENATPASILQLVANGKMYATNRAFLADLACALFPKHKWKR